MTRAALVNDGVPAFLAALVVVLVLALIAVIRLPRWTDTQTEEDEQRETGLEVSTGPAPDWAAPDSAGPGRAAPARARSAVGSGRSRPAHAKHGHTRPGPAAPRPPGQQAAGTSSLSVSGSARSQSGDADLAVRPGGQVPWRGTVRAPKVSGSPPWEPAPRPPG